MKKIFGILMLMGGLVSASHAQKLNLEKLPAPVKTAFSKSHPNQIVIWEKEKAIYEAEFFVKGKKISEIFTPTGLLVETEVEIKSTALPSAVLAKLKGEKIKEAAKITKADGSIRYEAEVRGKDLLFDANGNSVKN